MVLLHGQVETFIANWVRKRIGTDKFGCAHWLINICGLFSVIGRKSGTQLILLHRQHFVIELLFRQWID